MDKKDKPNFIKFTDVAEVAGWGELQSGSSDWLMYSGDLLAGLNMPHDQVATKHFGLYAMVNW